MENPFELIENKLNRIEDLLNEIKESYSKRHESDSDIKWFNLTELCHYHPSKPTKATVYGWVHSMIIPHYKSGKKLRFLKSEIDAWLSIGKRKTISEIEEDANNYLVKQKLRKTNSYK